jgi:hypothetical protein
MRNELLLSLIGAGFFAFIIFGWGMFGGDREDRKTATRYFWYLFFASLAVLAYNSDFWKSPLWQ